MPQKKFKTMIGGQALIEGIMMRGPDKCAVVVRAPDGIVSKVEDAKSPKDVWRPLGIPVIRGVAGFVMSMALGVKALTYSANFFPEDEEKTDAPPKEPSKLDKWADKHLNSETGMKVVTTISLALGLVLALFLFSFVPTMVAGLFPVGSGIWRNLTEGLLRLIILFLYLFLVSKMKDMKRVFSYHGAEHKTIACFEAGDELTVENVRTHSRFHPRCGTSFLLVIVVLSILCFSWVTADNSWVRLGLRLCMLPAVVGLAYEFNRLVGRYDNWFTRILRAPGLWMQRLTTVEPDDSMIEVGIEALKLVLPEEKEKAEWGRE